MKLKLFLARLERPSDNKTLFPEPAINKIPEWYKSLSRFYKSNSNESLHLENHIGTDGSSTSTKVCMPYFDALTMGYVFPLPVDIHVELDEDGKPSMTWDKGELPIDQRYMIDVPLPDNCHPIHYGWRMEWYYETPPGYSVMITHPMNRHDLPFYTLSGVVDADNWGLPVFISFFLKRGFRGTIPAGTPMFQMIPFKRDDWDLELIVDDKEALNKHELRAELRRVDLLSHYKKTTWVKKIFRSSRGNDGKN